jgi:ATP-dependent DNA helicase RecQ
MCPDDIATLENFSYGDTPTEESVFGVISELMSQPDTFDVSIYDLAARYDIRNLVLSTLLTYLELAGILESLGPHYNEYKFQPKRSSEEMLAGYDEERRTFLKKLFAQAKKGKTWFSIDLEAAAQKMGEDRKRLVSALNYLEEKGEMVLKVAGLRHGYRFVERPASSEVVAQRIHKRFQQSEKRDVERMQQVVDFCTSSACSVRQVLAYFGEELDKDCGHCDRCLGHAIPAMPESRDKELSSAELQVIRTLMQEGHQALKAPRQVARLLCGLASPAASRARLTRDPRFGSMAHYRFADIAKAAAI